MITKINTNPINISPKKVSFKSIYTNKLLLKTLKFASKNSSLFQTTVALGFATMRPVSILLTPKTDKKNKQIACAKSISSSAVGFLMMMAASTPIANAVGKIDKNPEKFLKTSTIKTLQDNTKKLSNSKKYMFATQLFKLGIGVLFAMPKSYLTCKFIPPIFNKIFTQNDKSAQHKTKILQTSSRKNSQAISFKGIYDKATKTLAKGIGKVIDTRTVTNASKKYSDTNFVQHIMNFTDVLLTGMFVRQTKVDKNIEQDRKKALIHNSIISTGLSIVGGYILNKALEKPTEKFIKNFKDANKNLADIEKYIEGIRIAKPALILGGIYYVIIPVISTFFADRTSKNLYNKN